MQSKKALWLCVENNHKVEFIETLHKNQYFRADFKRTLKNLKDDNRNYL
jgi:hypothetical protein